MKAAFPDGALFLARPDRPGDTSFSWIDQLAEHLNHHYPLAPGMTGVVLAHDPGDEFSFEECETDPKDLLASLDDALILDLALRHLRPGSAADRGARDWSIDGRSIRLIEDGATQPILIAVTDTRDVVAYEMRRPARDGEWESPDNDLGQLLADTTSSGWLVIPQFASEQADFAFTKAGQVRLRELLNGEPAACIAWIRSVTWSALGTLEDPIVGHHELPLFG